MFYHVRRVLTNKGYAVICSYGVLLLTSMHVTTYCVGEPFGMEGAILSPAPSISVNVTAINCLGQRAQVIILTNFLVALK